MVNLLHNSCCGCGACAAICPKTAIIMSEAEYGFVFPKIDVATQLSGEILP